MWGWGQTVQRILRIKSNNSSNASWTWEISWRHSKNSIDSYQGVQPIALKHTKETWRYISMTRGWLKCFIITSERLLKGSSKTISKLWESAKLKKSMEQQTHLRYASRIIEEAIGWARNGNVNVGNSRRLEWVAVIWLRLLLKLKEGHTRL